MPFKFNSNAKEFKFSSDAKEFKMDFTPIKDAAVSNSKLRRGAVEFVPGGISSSPEFEEAKVLIKSPAFKPEAVKKPFPF